MKEIKAVIRPAKLHAIRDAFRQVAGFPGMTVTKAQGCSGHAGEERHTTLKEELSEYAEKAHLEIVAPDEMVPAILDIIHTIAHTGHGGDGLLWVTEVMETRMIREPVKRDV